MINEKLKAHATAAIEAGVRRDGRKNDEFRPVRLERGVSHTAHGSSRVTCGQTVVIAGVKMEVGTPYPDTPDEGSLMVGAELLPLSNPSYESGPPSIESIELARVVDRAIRESKSIDLKALCIKSAEKMWIAAADIMPLNADGNLIDVGCLAVLAAMQDARLPKLVDGKPQYEDLSKEHVPMQHTPVIVTVHKVGTAYLVDPTEEEEDYSDARLSIATLEDGRLCALQKGGSGALTIADVDAMTQLAIRVSAKLRDEVLG